MFDFLGKLLASNFMPHGYCYLWDRRLLWLHATSDALIALAYYFIPIVLLYFVRRRKDLPFNWMFVMFAVFIFGCGTTHLMEVWTLWHGTYWVSGSIKALTAAVSLATAVALVPLVPKVLALRSPAEVQAAITKRNRAEAEVPRAAGGRSGRDGGSWIGTERLPWSTPRWRSCSATAVKSCWGRQMEMLVPERFRGKHPETPNEFLRPIRECGRWGQGWSCMRCIRMVMSFRWRSA